MSSKLTGVFIVLLVGVLIAAWWFAGQQPSPNAHIAYNNSGQQPQGAGVQPQSAQNSVAPTPDVSDEGLTNALSDIDSQIQNLDTDAANVDKGLDDQPIPQAQ